jgi:hypothetical protein
VDFSPADREFGAAAFALAGERDDGRAADLVADGAPGFEQPAQQAQINTSAAKQTPMRMPVGRVVICITNNHLP